MTERAGTAILKRESQYFCYYTPISPYCQRKGNRARAADFPIQRIKKEADHRVIEEIKEAKEAGTPPSHIIGRRNLPGRNRRRIGSDSSARTHEAVPYPLSRFFFVPFRYALLGERRISLAGRRYRFQRTDQESGRIHRVPQGRAAPVRNQRREVFGRELPLPRIRALCLPG